MRRILAGVLGAVALAAGPAAAHAATTAQAANQPAVSAHTVSARAAAHQGGSCWWHYMVEGDWVRIHTRPSLSSTTIALARMYDGSPFYGAPQPDVNGFTYMYDIQRGVSGWISDRYAWEFDCYSQTYLP
jgi:hypothetical protein